jgi:hypothetical protein
MGDDLAFAHQLADRADAITTARFAAPTDADVQVEDLLRRVVTARRAGDGFLGEEMGWHHCPDCRTADRRSGGGRGHRRRRGELETWTVGATVPAC